MRRDVFHTFDHDLKTVYDAFVEVLNKKPYERNPSLETNLISYSIGSSFKYNMNGGAVNIHFSREGNVTKIQIRYSIVQLFGARVGAYDEALIQKVKEVLETKPIIKASASTNFCSNCGTPLKEGSNFCPNCGNKIE